MPYRYDYGSLVKADSTKANNFKPLSEVAGTQDFGNQAIALLQAKGITSAADTTSFINNAANNAGDSTIKAMQNIANLTEEQTAEARGDTWGGSDDTMGKSWLEKIVAGDVDTSNISVEDLYQTGFGRASDEDGKDFWEKSGFSIQKIAESFIASEEGKIRTGYHDAYGRDADQSGLDYWMDHTGQEDYKGAGTASHGDFDASDLFKHVVADSSTAETNVRQRLSDELGLHSTDAQRAGDASLAGVFTDASEEDVFRMMQSGDFGASEIADKVRMQTAASHMGDYGGGVDDVGATGIHRMLANQEMGSVDSAGKWQSDAGTLAKTSADYLPSVEHTYDEDGNITSTTESNVWSLLKKGTQDYDPNDPGKDPVPPPDDDEDDDGDDGDDGIVVTNEDVDYTPELTSDVKDTSSYGASKDAFDNAAAGIDAPLQDMMIRNAQTMGVGGSAEGVRLKRSKKFKAGEAALGTKQLGRQLQLKSLNI